MLALMVPGAFATDSANAMQLAQLIDVALRDNKDLQAARYAVDIGRARLEQAGMRPNPRLDLSSRSDLLFGNDGEYNNAVMISQDFPIAGRILRQKDVARVDIALAEAEVADAERRLAGEVATDAYRLMLVDRQIATGTTLIEVQAQLGRTTRERFKAAEVSELDVNMVQLDLQQLTQERKALQGKREALQFSLNSRLGRPADAPLLIDVPISNLSVLPSLAKLQSQALAQRPDLNGALLAIDRARAERALAHASRWQDWSVGLELAQDKQVIDGAPPQGTNRSIGVSVSVPLPMFNKNQGLLAEADAMEGQAQARIEALRLGIASEVAMAHADATRLQSSLRQYDKDMLPISASNVALAQQGYRQGLVPVLEVVQAQRQQAQLNGNYLDMLDQYLQALVRLHTAVADYTPAIRPEPIY